MIERWRTRKAAGGVARLRCGFPRRGAGRARSGQSLVELALVSLMLLTIGVGAFEVGRAYHAALTVSHAARDGARVGGDSEATDGEIKAAAVASAKPLTLSTSNVSVNRATAGQVQVTANYAFTTPVPLVSNLWGGGALNISRSARARIE